jgi:arabinofuranan 3-O-arabinosyltransferase
MPKTREEGSLQITRPLRNHTFRWLLLVAAGVPLVLNHLLLTLLIPITVQGDKLNDFYVYLDGARDLAAGRNIYSGYFSTSIADATLNQTYIYPPLLAWLLQPLAGIDRHTAGIFGLIADQLSIGIFVVLVCRALNIKSLQAHFALLLFAIAFFPVRQNLYGAQINLVLLALASVWLLAHVRGGRWWGGVALGLAVAIKPIQAPYLLLPLLHRHWRLLAAAFVTGGAAWAIASPGYLYEYWTRVFPSLSGGTGFRENVSIAALLERLLNPASFFGQVQPLQPAVRPLSLLFALLVVVVTGFTIWRHPGERAYEASLVIAATPLLASLVWPSHLVLLLIPLTVTLVAGLRMGNYGLVAASAAAWLLIGPVKSLTLTLIVASVSSPWLLRPLAETSLLGMLILWLAAVWLVREASQPTEASNPVIAQAVTSS